MDASVQERIEMRNQMRNLDSFLAFPFGQDKRLALGQDKVHGYAVDSLREIDSQHITWKNYPAFWWKESLSLRKITHFIAEKVPVWMSLMQQDSQKLVKLELQCARLEKIVAKHNFKLKAANPKANLIPFVNPFRKALKINISYPAIIGQPAKTTVIRDVFYDRLTSSAELTAGVKEAMDKPVPIIVISSNVHKVNLDLILFSAVPNQLFNKVVQEPKITFDPSDDEDREDVQVVQVVYDDHDVGVLAGLIFKAGENQSIPHVYEQGFVAGKVAGFNDALAKMKSAFSG